MEQTPIPAEQRYPVRVEGTLDAELSRWLWLVKWLLAIPHYIVLAFLWVAFVAAERRRVLRDPLHRPVPAVDLRLQRRRAALDVARRLLHLRRARHRPLPALHARARRDYPATLDVDYPERLSRGLVLVKWWLLAIPQYLIVGVLRRRRTGSPGAGALDVELGRRPDRPARPARRALAALPGPLPARDLRLRARPRPLGPPGRRLRVADDRRVPAVPARPGWVGAWGSRRTGDRCRADAGGPSRRPVERRPHRTARRSAACSGSCRWAFSQPARVRSRSTRRSGRTAS